MNASSSSSNVSSALMKRLSNLAQLSPQELSLLRARELEARHWPARYEIAAEGEAVAKPLAVVRGWACRQKILLDGRRQIIGFVLPGDIIGLAHRPHAHALTSIIAVTPVATCALPAFDAATQGLAAVYAASREMDELFLLAQITRLGRLNAIERVADWLLETKGRLAMAGLAAGNQLSVPITQELLADTLGLTTVHVNRTLQSMRQAGLMTFNRGLVTLLDEAGLNSLVVYRGT